MIENKELGTYRYYSGGIYSAILITVSLPSLKKKVVFVGHQFLGNYPPGTFYDTDYEEFFGIVKNKKGGFVPRFEKIDETAFLKGDKKTIGERTDLKKFIGG